MNDVRAFRKEIVQKFNLEEIKTICFDLKINFDNLPGDRLESKVRALLIDVYRTEKLPQLYNILTDERPHAAWIPLSQIESYRWDNLDDFNEEKSISLGKGLIALAQLVEIAPRQLVFNRRFA